jgi:hypothetical protein
MTLSRPLIRLMPSGKPTVTLLSSMVIRSKPPFAPPSKPLIPWLAPLTRLWRMTMSDVGGASERLHICTASGCSLAMMWVSWKVLFSTRPRQPWPMSIPSEVIRPKSLPVATKSDVLLNPSPILKPVNFELVTATWSLST